jgi:hypothetical protein
MTHPGTSIARTHPVAFVARGATATSAALLLGAVLLVAMMLLRVSVSGDSIFDVPAFLLAMGWLLATPVAVTAAVVASRRIGWRLGQGIAWPVGALWLTSVVFVATLH